MKEMINNWRDMSENVLLPIVDNLYTNKNNYYTIYFLNNQMIWYGADRKLLVISIMYLAILFMSLNMIVLPCVYILGSR